MTNNKHKNNKHNRAFTLIELMVATSIFVVIMLSSMGALFTLIGASKNSRALRFAMDNVNFSMESMTRSIRMGTNYYCAQGSSVDLNDLNITQPCPSGGTLITFLPQDNLSSRVGFMLKTRDDGSGTHTIQRCVVDSGGANCVDIVSSLVNIEQLKFFVKGPASDDNIQASVYIIMKGTVKIKGLPTSFAIQTMASQRNF